MKFKHIGSLALGLLVIFTLAAAQSTPPERTNPTSNVKTSQPKTGGKTIVKSDSAQTGNKPSEKLGPAPVESDWRGRAMKWFKSDVLKERGKQMRMVSRALKKPCKYCHTKDFKGFTQNRLITQQMMALSTEHGVECSDCHAGRGQLTEFGKKSQPMWRLVHSEKVFCDHCHTKQSKFEKLTPAGQAHKEKVKNSAFSR